MRTSNYRYIRFGRLYRFVNFQVNCHLMSETNRGCDEKFDEK